MNLFLKRIYKGSAYTIGKLYIDGKYFCDTLEDVDRGLTNSMPLSVIRSKKISGQTAIPIGKYQVTLAVKSPKYSKIDYYKQLCAGYVPRLEEVKGYSGVLIHCGNTVQDTDGCILVGRNKKKGMVLDSRATFEKLYTALTHQIMADEREPIYITIE